MRPSRALVLLSVVLSCGASCAPAPPQPDMDGADAARPEPRTRSHARDASTAGLGQDPARSDGGDRDASTDAGAPAANAAGAGSAAHDAGRDPMDSSVRDTGAMDGAGEAAPDAADEDEDEAGHDPIDGSAPDAAIDGGAPDAAMDAGGGEQDSGGGPPDGGDADGRVDETPPVSWWRSFGADLDNTRSSPSETRISRESVAGLRRAWQIDAPGVTATPAVVDGVVYWADWDGTAYAHRLEDGAELWRRSFAVGFTSSPCVEGERVYLADRRNTVHALERDSGEPIWATVVNEAALTHLWSSPMVVDGIVIIGIAADATSSNGVAHPPGVLATLRGAVLGLHAEDGAIAWRFETTRVVGEADVYGPGVSVWGTAAVDREREALFVGTGNGFATPVSPYSDALLAIRYRTGELAWSTQFTSQDAFSSGNPSGGPDSDVGAGPNLFRLLDGDLERDVVGVGDKTGTYRVLDRDSGEIVWERVLSSVPSTRKTGGVIAPAAYAEDRIFVASNTSSSASRIWALDAHTGGVLWQSRTLAGLSFGGLAVANGVLFAGGSGFRVGMPASGIGVGSPGELVAFDARDGTELLSAPLRAGRGGGFSIAQGRVLIGSGFTFFASNDEPLVGALEVFAVP